MNIIKVKVLNENGKVKGRAYTYKSHVDVEVGDIVIADMAGHDKHLEVVETRIPESKIKNLDYEVKTIKGLAEDFEIDMETDVAEQASKNKDDSSVDIEILEEHPPVISINFDEIKTNLTDNLSKYQGVVVTEQTLSGCKATQKELAGLKKKIDRYRIDKKKELSAPITTFEGQCKELVSLIESVENPIKEGIKIYDDKKKNQKREIAVKLTTEVVEEIGLEEKYASRLEILDRYFNLTAKAPDVKSDIRTRAKLLKEQQDRDKELLEIIKDTVEAENKKLKKKMTVADIQQLINAGASTQTILEDIRARASIIYEAENPKLEPLNEPDVEEIEYIEETAETNKEMQQEDNPECFAVFRVQGKLSELKDISNHLHNYGRGVTCKTQQQGRL